MGLLIDKKTLYVHIPKTGGTMIVRNFKDAYPNQYEWEGTHSPLDILINVIITRVELIKAYCTKVSPC